ncbi:MAG TPA: NAD(P)-dependent oxidoreductase [Solirubrobacterales bacterium]
MRVFVAGACGAMGRPLVRRLVAAGHEVTGTTRREERAEGIRAAGAAAAVCDVYDDDALADAVAGASPEVVVHALTALPDRIDWKAKEDPLAATNRLREEGTRNLIGAARAAGARRVIGESVAFLYEPSGEWIKDEDAPLFTDAPGRAGDAVAALADLEGQVLEAEGIEGVVLRFGWFYGPGTSYARDRAQAEDFRRRRFPIVGRGTGVFSFIHVEDVADATLAAVDGDVVGVFNVVDDDPARQREWAPVYAEAVGAKRPRRAPLWLAKLIAGPVALTAVELRGASNARAKRELGWQPRYPSWRQGFREALG